MKPGSRDFDSKTQAGADGVHNIGGDVNRGYVWRHRRLISANVLLWMAVPCVAQNAARPHIAGRGVRQTVAPGKMSAISVSSLPNAVCTLRAQDDSGVVRTLQLYADDQGEVRFHVRPSGETDNPPNVQLSCETSEQVMDHGIELRANAASAAAASPVRQAGGRKRPALTGDPMLASQEELLSRGYPMRPDPDATPEAYATWLRIVTQEATEIEPKTVTRPGFRGGRSTQILSPIGQRLPSAIDSTNWSGFAVYRDPYIIDLRPPQPYVFATSEWFVPSVAGEQGVQDFSALWVGMDGLTNGDVLQDGTEQDAIGMNVLGIKWTMASFSAWVEFFPADSVALTNFKVSPGDHMLGQVWMGNPGSAPTLSGAFGVCYLFDLTTGSFTTVYIPPPLGAAFAGSSAEWIMERPTVNGAGTDLPAFGGAMMLNAWAKRTDGTIVEPCGSIYSVPLTMVNGAGAPLSTATCPSNSSIVFNWLGFK